ncbi:radical SAM protein [Sorangium sp. So ce269]
MNNGRASSGHASEQDEDHHHPPEVAPDATLLTLTNRHRKPRKVVDNPRVMLMRPPQLFYFGVWPRGPRLSLPIGLLSIGSFLKRNGVDVVVYDCFVEGDTFADDRELARSFRSTGALVSRWIRTFEDGAISGEDAEHRKLQHFGASWDQLERDLLRIKPDIVGITNLFRENTEETLTATRLIRKVLPDCAIVVGGPNANALPDYMLEKSDAIDLIGFGDGEKTMLEVVEWVRGRRNLLDIGGLLFRSPTGAPVRTPASAYVNDLDTLGQLDYSLLKTERYFTYERNGIMARNKFSYDGAERSVSLVTSRGCPYKCSFCSIHIHAGRRYRRYSVEHTLDHIETLVNRLGVKHIHFEDDNLTLDRDRLHRLMDGVLERRLRFTWDTPNGVFANTLDLEMMQKMKATGCTYLVVGVESGDQWVLDNVIMKQPLTLEHVLNAFRLGKQVGIDMQAFYIIGFPRESLAQIRKTLKFALDCLRDHDVIPHMALARADPGTALFQEASETGTLRTNYAISNAGGAHADSFQRHTISTKEFTPELLEQLNSEFHREAMRIIATKTAAFLARHPSVALTNGAYFARSVVHDNNPLKDSVVKLFFCRLFYRNCLLSEAQGPAAPVPPARRRVGPLSAAAR